MNPVGIMLLGAFICMGSTIALYVINVINLKDKLIPLSNVVLTIILASSLVFLYQAALRQLKKN